MLDLSHIPNSQQNTEIFYSNGITNAWQTWRKPKKCSFVYIICIGSGAGGGAGTTVNSSGTGTGGGSGAITRALYLSQHLPDNLYIQVGVGGGKDNKQSLSIVQDLNQLNFAIADAMKESILTGELKWNVEFQEILKPLLSDKGLYHQTLFLTTNWDSLLKIVFGIS